VTASEWGVRGRPRRLSQRGPNALAARSPPAHVHPTSAARHAVPRRDHRAVRDLAGRSSARRCAPDRRDPGRRRTRHLGCRTARPRDRAAVDGHQRAAVPRNTAVVGTCSSALLTLASPSTHRDRHRRAPARAPARPRRRPPRAPSIADHRLARTAGDSPRSKGALDGQLPHRARLRFHSTSPDPAGPDYQPIPAGFSDHTRRQDRTPNAGRSWQAAPGHAQPF